jgi:hypothetical protein
MQNPFPLLYKLLLHDGVVVPVHFRPHPLLREQLSKLAFAGYTVQNGLELRSAEELEILEESTAIVFKS